MDFSKILGITPLLYLLPSTSSRSDNPIGFKFKIYSGKKGHLRGSDPCLPSHPPPWVLGTSCLPSPPPLPLPSVVCSRPSSHSEIRSLFDQNPPVIVVVGRLMAPKHPWPYAWSLCATSLGEKDPADVIKRMGLHGEGTLSHPSGFNSNPTSPPAGLRSEKWRCGPGRMLRGMSGEKDLTPSSWL